MRFQKTRLAISKWLISLDWSFDFCLFEILIVSKVFAVRTERIGKIIVCGGKDDSV